MRTKVTSRHGWLGDYDYGWLCMPTFPWCRRRGQRSVAPPFYGLDQELPLLLAITTGLQHALAMLAGMPSSMICHKRMSSHACRSHYPANYFCECAPFGRVDVCLYDLRFPHCMRYVPGVEH